MSKAVKNLQAVQKRAMAGRPKVGGFPYLAETLRRAGVIRDVWSLPFVPEFVRDLGRPSKQSLNLRSNFRMEPTRNPKLLRTCIPRQS
jgi:uncharacterized protein YbcV (DUF1398 family)